jgi:hypothetical protein
VIPLVGIRHKLTPLQYQDVLWYSFLKEAIVSLEKRLEMGIVKIASITA